MRGKGKVKFSGSRVVWSVNDAGLQKDSVLNLPIWYKFSF
jgi:hypothetical protein